MTTNCNEGFSELYYSIDMSGNIWDGQKRRAWMVALFFGCCLLYAARNIMPVCSHAIAMESGWTRQDEGLVLGIFFWGYMFTQFLGGLLSDMFGGQLVILSSTFVWGIVTLSFTMLPLASTEHDGTFHFFLISRFFLGFFQGFFYPSLASLMAKHVKTSDRQFTYAFITSGAHAGTLFSGLVGSFLTEIFTWRIPFFLIGSLAVLWSALVFQTMLRFPPPVLFLHKVGPVPSPPIKPSSYRQGSGLVSFEFALTPSGSLSLQKHQTCSAASSSPPPPSLVEVATAVATSDNLRGSAALRAASAVPLNWRRLCRKSAFWSMIFGNFTFNNTFLIILNWSPSFFHDRFPESQSWVFNVVPWLIVIPCSLLSGVLADKLITQGLSVTLVRKIITTIALFGTSLFLLILPRLQTFMLSLICLGLAVACCGFHSSGILLNPQDIAPLHGGKVFGIMSTIGTIPGFTGVYLTGYILQHWGSWSAVFHFAVLGNLFGWIVYSIFGSAKPLV
uniref:Solute carrier family 17 member 9 n=2 Tax=Schistocephalus solidus TaxID=70667 RepID=A0A0X3QEP4_SCHSO